MALLPAVVAAVEHSRRARALVISAREVGFTDMSERAAPDLTAAERRLSLVTAIASAAVFGIGIGFAMPLFSLLLEARGTEASMTGLNAASAYLGVIIGPLATPFLVRLLGIRAFLLACLGLDVVLFLAMKLFDGLGAWFALRIGLGLAGSSLFTATEAWINMLASDAGRGRIIGFYVASLSAGFAAGPLLLAYTGIAGWTPFILGSAVNVVAAVPLLLIGNLAGGLGREPGAHVLAFFLRAPFIMTAVALYGVFESTTFALLPIWGVRIGLDAARAATTLTAIGLGSLVLQVPIGWLSDTLARRTLLRFCGAAGLVGALIVPLLAGGDLALYVALFVWGGAAAGIYPLALGIAGERFRGAELIGVNAALIIAYGLGSLAGPALGGAAMDLWNPHGLLAALALLFAGLLLATLRRPVPAA
jgi:MFS family permease